MSEALTDIGTVAFILHWMFAALAGCFFARLVFVTKYPGEFFAASVFYWFMMVLKQTCAIVIFTSGNWSILYTAIDLIGLIAWLVLYIVSTMRTHY